MVTRECMLTTVMTVGAAWEVGLATETGIFGAAVDRQPSTAAVISRRDQKVS